MFDLVRMPYYPTLQWLWERQKSGLHGIEAVLPAAELAWVMCPLIPTQMPDAIFGAFKCVSRCTAPEGFGCVSIGLQVAPIH